MARTLRRPFVLVAAALCAATAGGQDRPPAITSPAGSGGLDNPDIAPDVPDRPLPRQPDGTPDLTGVWQGGGSIGDISTALLEGEEMILLPDAQAILDSRMSRDDPEANCLPTGVPRIAPFPWRIVQDPPHGKPTHLFFLFEGNIHSYRQIFLDGREPPDDLEASWYGHSVGHWEGDTLVVDTVGYNDKFWFDFRGHPHTQQLRTIERYRRIDYGTLENVVTIIDPGAYEKPFTVRFTAELRPGWELMEYICNENNQDVEHIEGAAGL